MAAYGWNDEAQKPVHDRAVLALERRDNDGYTAEADFIGGPHAWAIARCDAKTKQWKVLRWDPRGFANWYEARIGWWRELPSIRGMDVLIVPPLD
jgi:hypothetical protein